MASTRLPWSRPGQPAESAIAAGTIALEDDTLVYAALLGTLDSASVGLFAVDDRPLDQGRARFRIISGVPDAGEIVPIFAGGDALSEPLGFGDASQYASIDAGTYDLDLLEAASGVPLLALPQTPFAEGTTTDVILVGQVSDGSLIALVQPIQVELARAVGRSAQIFTGSCAELEAVAADLGIVQAGSGRGWSGQPGRIRCSGIRRCRDSLCHPGRVSARRRCFGGRRCRGSGRCLRRDRRHPDRHRGAGDRASAPKTQAPRRASPSSRRRSKIPGQRASRSS